MCLVEPVLQLTHISVLPESIGQLQSLTELWLTGNAIAGKSIFSVFVVPVDLASVLTHISALPDSIGQLSNLKELYCRDCKLTGTCIGLPVDLASVLTHNSVLPESFGQLSSLETHRLGGNKLTGAICF
jgi:Leucine-rich repeat (LRR) protein